MTLTAIPRQPDAPAVETEDPSGMWAHVQRAQNGDTSAFGPIYDCYVDSVFRFVYRRVKTIQMAEDLTSETFLRAFTRIGSFTWQGRDLGAWLCTIAKNMIYDYHKSARHRLELTTWDVLDVDRADSAIEARPEDAVVAHMTNLALMAAINELNPEQRECLVLRFLRGLSVAETAAAMGKTEGAVKAEQYRAVRALARVLPEGFQP